MKRIGLFLFALCSLVVAAQKKIKVSCVGNSITYGLNVENREANAYPAQLQRLLGEAYEVGNFGKSGATLLRKGHRPYMQQEEFRKAMDFRGDIAVIHLGVNDTDPRNWPNHRDEFVQDYLTLIDSLRQVNPKVRVLLARLTPIGDKHPRFRSGTKQWQDEIRQLIGTIARISGSELIDFYEPLHAFPHLLPDAIHPNAAGAALLAKTVYSGITGNYGGLRLSPLYADGMVLQRGKSLTLEGVANAGAKIKVRVAGKNAKGTTDNRGKWSVTLPALPVGENYELVIEADQEKRTFRNVAVGEVWLCSGQSNMEWRLKHTDTAAEDLARANDPALRLYNMQGCRATHNVSWPLSALDSLNHLQYFRHTPWTSATPDAVREFSAVAYHFGKMLRDSLKVPVGLICNAVGGSPTEAWIDRQTLETQFPDILRDWLNNDFIQDWVRTRAAVNIKNAEGKFARHPYEPCYLFESGIAPLGRYGIQGVIWYQGESNAHNFTTHETLFRLLTESWRTHWERPDLPFYYVQLSSLNRPSWTWFRDSQRRLMETIPHTGMAVSSDHGDSLDVHPRHKRAIGQRLGRRALHDTYQQRSVTPSGPLPKKAVRKGKYIVVTFDYAKGLAAADGKTPIGFEIAEEEGLFQAATVRIEGNRIYLSAKGISQPRFVRYAWQPFTRANLVNSDGLPASTFRLEVEQ